MRNTHTHTFIANIILIFQFCSCKTHSSILMRISCTRGALLTIPRDSRFYSAFLSLFRSSIRLQYDLWYTIQPRRMTRN